MQDTIHDIQVLSQSALKEMRELIMRLRPPGLEEGLMTGLKQYGERLKLHVSSHINGIRDLPRTVEETLWRIGQEALNNVSKHADTREVRVVLTLRENEVELGSKIMVAGFQATIERADKTFDWVVQHAGTGGIARRTIPSIQCVQRGNHY